MNATFFSCHCKIKTAENIVSGKQVAELRKNAGYSQEQIAFKCALYC
jgi:hypothetical protein